MFIAYIIVMLYTCFLCSNSFDKQVFLILWEPREILVSLAKHPLPSAPPGPKISRSVQLLPFVASIMTISQKWPCASKAQHSCECKRGGITLQAKKALSMESFPAWSHDQWPSSTIMPCPSSNQVAGVSPRSKLEHIQHQLARCWKLGAVEVQRSGDYPLLT